MLNKSEQTTMRAEREMEKGEDKNVGQEYLRKDMLQ